MSCLERSVALSGKQPHQQRPTLRWWGAFVGSDLVLQVIDYCPDQHRVFDAGNGLLGTTADTAGFDIDAERLISILRISAVTITNSVLYFDILNFLNLNTHC